jgi:uncharacterized membrane protein YjjB (DUF3815 family)
MSLLDLVPYIREFILAAVATLGFGLLFNVPRRTLLACCLTGGTGRMIRLIAISAGISLEAGSFIGAMVVATMGYIFARIYHTPRTIFTVTGVIPMVPGVPAFTSMLQMANGNIDDGLISGVQTVLIGGALAVGLTTIRVLTRVPENSTQTE